MFASNWLSRLLLASILAGAAAAADVDSAALLNSLKARVRENATTIPRFVCRIRLEREDYTTPQAGGACRIPGEREFPEPQQPLELKDRANLDVMLSQKSELFAWPGGQRFDADSPNNLLGDGFAGSGDFAGFALTVFTSPASTFTYLGPCGSGTCVRYRYEVPSFASHYFIRTAMSEVNVGYHGTFDVNPDTVDLISLIVIPTDVHKAVPEACDLRASMIYAKAAIATGVFTIPQSTEKLYTASDGTVFRNLISYQGCRQYSSESSISFGDEESASAQGSTERLGSSLPAPGTTLELRLASKIDSDKNAAGDAIEAKLAKPVKDSEGHTIAAGTVFRGHLGHMENIYGPRPRVLVSLRLEEMVVRGKPVPVTLRPTGFVDQRGRQQFSFAGRRVVVQSQLVFRQTFGGVAGGK